MSDAHIQHPVRDTEIPASPDISVGALLGTGDVDRLSALCHALIEEIADLSTRVACLEAAQAGQAAPDDLAAVQARTAAIVARVLG
jgi:hypothetical protein